MTRNTRYVSRAVVLVWRFPVVSPTGRRSWVYSTRAGSDDGYKSERKYRARFAKYLSFGPWASGALIPRVHCIAGTLIRIIVCCAEMTPPLAIDDYQRDSVRPANAFFLVLRHVSYHRCRVPSIITFSPPHFVAIIHVRIALVGALKEEDDM